MCTLSWLIGPQGYQLFFNRDEQRSRSKALPPQRYESSGVAMLMPLDPDGGGSWIAVNDRGLSLCLLNFYQGRLPAGPLKSRGQLLKSLSTLQTQLEVETELASVMLHQYAPFTLLALALYSADTCEIEISSQSYQWDGHELKTQSIQSPMTSSSVEFDSVYAARQRNFSALSDAPDADQLLEYHQSHQNCENLDSSASHQRRQNGQIIEGHQSVCMHRNDAKTVSFSHISVTAEQASFSYLDGSPCQHKLSNTESLLAVAGTTRLPLKQPSYSPSLLTKDPLTKDPLEQQI